MSIGASDAQSGPSPRVPAWKRIGLTLKRPSDSTNDPQLPQQAAGSSSELHHADDASVNIAPPSKRRKSNGHESRDATKITTLPTDEKSNKLPVSSSKSSEPVPKFRRKSVTFSSETKGTDGYSAGALADQLTDSPSEALQASPSPKKSKKDKKSKRSKANGVSPSIESGDPDSSRTQAAGIYLDYLDQFHNDKANWKFNKAKQNDVLKYALNIHRIPSAHQPALLAYLGGLQGAAAAQRLFDAATATLREIAVKEDAAADYDNMESGRARRAAYKAALQRHLDKLERAGNPGSEYEDEQLEQLRIEADRGRRAEAVMQQLLLSALVSEDDPLQHASAALAANGSAGGERPGAVKKNRKARTQANSPSPSSSSSSDSDSDGEDAGPKAAERGSKSSRPAHHTSTTSAASRAGAASASAAREPVRPRPNLPEAPGYGPAASGAIPAGFQIGASGVNKRKKIFDDDLLEAAFPKKTK